MGNLVFEQSARRTPCTTKGTSNTHDHNNGKLCPRKEEYQRNLGKHHLLKHHSEADDGSNHDSQKATRRDQDKCFIHIKHLNLVLGISHGSEHSQLLRLIQQVGAHTGTKGEEAEKHGDGNDDREDDVEDETDLVGGLSVVKIVEDLDAVGLDWVELGLALSDEFLDDSCILRVLELDEQSLPFGIIQAPCW